MVEPAGRGLWGELEAGRGVGVGATGEVRELNGEDEAEEEGEEEGAGEC